MTELKKRRAGYRKCQDCGTVSPLEAFKKVPAQRAYSSATVKYRCPGCSYEAPLWAFLPAEPPTPPVS
jgi:hypothetical protein